MQIQLLLFLLMFIIYGVNIVTAKRIEDFAYVPGKCEVTISSVIEDVVRNEMRALFEPTLRAPDGEKRLRYDLYTPLNPQQRQVLRAGDEPALSRSNFNAQWPVRISIHGWAGKGSSCSNAAIKDAYLSRGSFNVIIVDWSAHAMDVSYRRISKQFPAIAANLVELLQFLHNERGISYSDVHLIGHSAGSHIAGLVGKQLRANTQQQLAAIYALDPAGLTQLNWPPEQRLAPDDAVYVESIHSDITLLGNPSAALSQVAFFANWGQGQPHCLNATATEFDFACDHFGSLYYFAESVQNSRAFGAIQCKMQSPSPSPSPTPSLATPADTNTLILATKSTSLASFSCQCHKGVRDDNNYIDYDVTATATATSCAAQIFMGDGEPLTMTKPRGVYYFSTTPQQPYGRGEVVVVQPVLAPTVLRKRVSLFYRYIRI